MEQSWGKLEERYAYYRRCQRFRKSGMQCKAPAMKGQDVCYKHEAQEETGRRRAAMRQKFALPPLADFKSVQSGIREVGKAIIDGRIDEDYAGELLNQLQNAAVALRRMSRSESCAGRVAPGMPPGYSCK
jgi:hypothetical protein